jgi:hypothetical protein
MDVVQLEHLDRRIQQGEDVEQIGYFVPSCPHAFCTPCLAQYLEIKLKAPVTQFPVKCPHYDCQNNVVDSLAARVLDVDVMELWWDKQTEAGMSNKIYCPHPDCAVPLENDIARTGCDYMTECPVCNRAFCSACVSPWHPGNQIFGQPPNLTRFFNALLCRCIMRGEYDLDGRTKRYASLTYHS